jgi:hypothetical protein
VQPADAAGGHEPCGTKTVVAIEAERPEFFVVQRRESWARPSHDGIAVWQPGHGVEGRRLYRAASELDGGGEPGCLGRTDATALGEFTDAGAQQSADASVLVK